MIYYNNPVEKVLGSLKTTQNGLGSVEIQKRQHQCEKNSES